MLDQGTGTSTAAERMFFQILDAIAEFEHALMSERTLDSLAAARARGNTGGQKPKLIPRQARIARQMYEETDASIPSPRSAEFGIPRPTIYPHIAKLPATADIQWEAVGLRACLVQLDRQLIDDAAQERPGGPLAVQFRGRELLAERAAAVG